MTQWSHDRSFDLGSGFNPGDVFTSFVRPNVLTLQTITACFGAKTILLAILLNAIIV